MHDRQSHAAVASRRGASEGQQVLPAPRDSRMRRVSVASSAWVGAERERFAGGAASSARERFPGAGSSRITQAADTRPSASKTTPSLSSSARFRWTAGAAAPHSPLNPPRRRSDAITRCQGTLVSAGQFLRITAPTDRAQPPATLATAPYVVTLPLGTLRTTACTLDSKAVGILSRATRRRRNASQRCRCTAYTLHSTTQMLHGFERMQDCGCTKPVLGSEGSPAARSAAAPRHWLSHRDTSPGSSFIRRPWFLRP